MATTRREQSQTLPSYSADWQLTDAALLEEIVSRAFLYFWYEASPHTGLVRDRALADGFPDPRRIASIAATGFGLAASCIGHQRHYVPSKQIYARVIATLNFLLNHAEQVNGFFYHFLDIETGRRVNRCEVSPIDTTILLCGILTARGYFQHPEIHQLSTTLYRRVNWRWMLNGGRTFAMCWTPEAQFSAYRWDKYSELMMMYLLAIAAPHYSISPASWDALARPLKEFAGHACIGGDDPLFVHLYSQAWFDFRGRRDGYADYFVNSALPARTECFVYRCVGVFPATTSRPGALPPPILTWVTGLGRAPGARRPRRNPRSLRGSGFNSISPQGYARLPAKPLSPVWFACLEAIWLRKRS